MATTRRPLLPGKWQGEGGRNERQDETPGEQTYNHSQGLSSYLVTHSWEQKPWMYLKLILNWNNRSSVCCMRCDQNVLWIWPWRWTKEEDEIPKVQFAHSECVYSRAQTCMEQMFQQVLYPKYKLRVQTFHVWSVVCALKTQGFCGHTKSVRSTFARLVLLWLPPDLLIEIQLERLVLRCSGGHPVYIAEINMHKDMIPKTFWSPLKKLQKVVNRQWPLKKIESLAKLGLKQKSNKANAPLLLWMIN